VPLDLKGIDQQALLKELQDFIRSTQNKPTSDSVKVYVDELKERLLKHVIGGERG